MLGPVRAPQRGSRPEAGPWARNPRPTGLLLALLPRPSLQHKPQRGRGSNTDSESLTLQGRAFRRSGSSSSHEPEQNPLDGSGPGGCERALRVFTRTCVALPPLCGRRCSGGGLSRPRRSGFSLQAQLGVGAGTRPRPCPWLCHRGGLPAPRSRPSLICRMGGALNDLRCPPKGRAPFRREPPGAGRQPPHPRRKGAWIPSCGRAPHGGEAAPRPAPGGAAGTTGLACGVTC